MRSARPHGVLCASAASAMLTARAISAGSHALRRRAQIALPPWRWRCPPPTAAQSPEVFPKLDPLPRAARTAAVRASGGAFRVLADRCPSPRFALPGPPVSPDVDSETAFSTRRLAQSADQRLFPGRFGRVASCVARTSVQVWRAAVRSPRGGRIELCQWLHSAPQ